MLILLKKINKKIFFISLIIILFIGFSFSSSAARIIFFGGESAEEIIIFSAVGNHSWTPPSGVESIEVLVVAGGGGGSENQYDDGAGGGAGGVIYDGNFRVSNQAYSIVVGAGGAVYANGQNSSFGSLVAIGGGRGGGHRGGASGANGGSGGGSGGQYSGTDNNGSGTGTPGQGHNGGKSTSYAGGGGGGAGQPGIGASVWQVGGKGGDGLQFYISGDLKFYGGGGGGFPNGSGGLGGGGSAGIAGQANTGGGGGGGKMTGLRAQPGGSGLVIIRFTKTKSKSSSLQKGLIAHWTMDQKDYNFNINKLSDKTPYLNHGINSGASSTIDRHGNEGGAMSFNNQKIETPLTTTPEDMSFSVWFRKTTESWDSIAILGKRNGQSGWMLYRNSGDKNGYFRWYMHYLNTSDTVSAYIGWPGIDGLENNKWHHIVVTRSYNGESIIYKDGELYGSWGRPSNFKSWIYNTNGISIGSERVGSNNWGLVGAELDDLRIYNRVISHEEVKNLYNSYSPNIVISSLQKGLILDMPLKSDYTKTVIPGSQIMTDRTPYSNNGQNYGGIVSESWTSFNGTSQYIANLDSVNPALFEPSSITVSSWINMDLDASTVRHIWLTKWLGYSFEIEANTRIPYFRLNGPGDIKSNTAVTLGNWHHLVGTYDPSIGGRIYLDGKLVGTRAAVGQITHSRSHPLNVGRYSGGVYFKGKISSVRIYNRALSAEEVMSLYDRGY